MTETGGSVNSSHNAENVMPALVAAFNAAYEVEWDRVAELAEGSAASGAADRAATEAGIRAAFAEAAALSVEIGPRQAAALLAKIEAADRLASMAEDVRQRFIDFAPAPGDLFAIEALRQEIAAYRNPQPAAEGEGK